MSKVEQLKSKFLEIQSIDDVYNYFSFLGFQVRENDGAFIFNIAEDEFIEIFFYEEKSEINKRINSFTYNRYCVLAVPQDFSSMTFVKIGYEGKSKIVRYTIKKEEIRNRENPIGIQRVSKLKYEQIETFDDLFDRKDVSKRFYTDYSKKRLQLVKQIQGVADPDDKRLYAQVLLDRIIFLYFLQKKHLLEKDERYLVRKLAEYENKKSNFYENFLKRFFLETLCVKLEDRDASWIQETGELIPYLNGGLFLTHELEQKHPDISIPNKAFQEIFAFLESWLWYSSERSDTDEDVIDPYILGYIFEKSLGENKSQGVYYTPPFLSSFLSRETIENFLLYFIQNNLKIKCIKVSEFLSSASEKDLLAYYEKLSNITVCDPACGSGQFLIEALHELSELHLNLLEVVKTNNLESLKKEYKKDMDSPSPSIYTIRRFIVSKNIYGVDLLPEAVEIAKLRLFIAMIEGITDKVEEPLPNIDFHVVCGNSLVGFTSSPFENTGKAEQQGLFPGAKKQQTERLFDFYDIRKSFEEREDLIKAYFSVENPKAALKKRDEIHQKTGALKQLFHKDFNTKISGVWKVKPKNKIDFIDLKKDTSAIKQFKEFKIQAEDLNAFHWVMEFSEIMNKGGFDIMLLNPPWETWKPNSQEFFEKHLDGYRKLDKIQAKKKVEETLKKDTKLKKLWMEYSMGLSSVSEYFRSCEDYPARGKGDINLYKLFLERAFYLLKTKGSLGIVMPSGFYTDLGCKELRELFFAESKVQFLYGFENRKKMFEDVDSRFKFVAYNTIKTKEGTKDVPAAFMMLTENEMMQAHNRKGKYVSVNLETLKKFSPDSLSLMEFSSKKESDITEKIYAEYPLLGEEIEGTWNVKLISESHITNNSYLFNKNKNGIPLFEGKMIWQYDSNYDKPKFWVDNKMLEKVSHYNYNYYRWGHRRIASNTNERTLISSIIPKKSLSEVNCATINIEKSNISNSQQLFFSSIMNSYILDYTIRLKVSATLNVFYLLSLPIPRFQSDKDHPYFSKLVERAAKLVGTTEEFDELLEEVGLKGKGSKKPHEVHGVKVEKERQALKNQIDAMVAKIYKLTREELEYILSTFPLVKDEVKLGVLEEYDRL